MSSVKGPLIQLILKVALATCVTLVACGSPNPRQQPSAKSSALLLRPTPFLPNSLSLGVGFRV